MFAQFKNILDFKSSIILKNIPNNSRSFWTTFLDLTTVRLKQLPNCSLHESSVVWHCSQWALGIQRKPRPIGRRSPSENWSKHFHFFFLNILQFLWNFWHGKLDQAISKSPKCAAWDRYRPGERNSPPNGEAGGTYRDSEGEHESYRKRKDSVRKTRALYTRFRTCSSILSKFQI